MSDKGDENKCGRCGRPLNNRSNCGNCDERQIELLRRAVLPTEPSPATPDDFEF